MQRHHPCFKEALTLNLLENLLETCPFMSVLIFTLSIHLHILLLLSFIYWSKIPFSLSTPNKRGMQSSRDNANGMDNQQCEAGEEQEALTSLFPGVPTVPVLHRGWEEGLSSWDLPHQALSSQCWRQPTGQEEINEEVPWLKVSKTRRASMNPAEERILALWPDLGWSFLCEKLRK